MDPYLTALNIQIDDAQCVVLDERAPFLHHVAHQSGEDFVGRVGLGDLDL